MTTYAETRTTSPDRLLRRALLADAVVSGATGLLMAGGALFLDDLLGLPTMLLAVAGLALLPYAGALEWLATRRQVPTAAVWAVIVANLAWATESIMMLVLDWVQPTTLGAVFVIGQALVVAGFADLQYLGLRRAR